MEDLIFKRQGEVIYESDTALSCELVENDVIEVAKINWRFFYSTTIKMFFIYTILYRSKYYF